MRRAFARYTVVGFYADPPYWLELVNAWERDFGDELLVHASGSESIRYWTKHTTRIAQARSPDPDQGNYSAGSLDHQAPRFRSPPRTPSEPSKEAALIE